MIGGNRTLQNGNLKILSLLRIKTQELEAISSWRKVMLSGTCVTMRTGHLTIVSVTYIIISTFSDGKMLSLVEWSLNPVSMLHYNKDFMYPFVAKDDGYSFSDSGIHTDTHDGQTFVGLKTSLGQEHMAALVRMWLALNGSNRADSFISNLIDSWMFSGLPGVTVFSLETNIHKIGFIHWRIQTWSGLFFLSLCG